MRVQQRLPRPRPALPPLARSKPGSRTPRQRLCWSLPTPPRHRPSSRPLALHVPDTAVDTAVSTTAGAANVTEPAEPEMEEVWRPRRRRDHGRGEERRHQGRGGRRHDRNRRNGQSQAPQSPPLPQPEGQATDPAAPAEAATGQDQPPHEQRRHERPHRGDRPGRGDHHRQHGKGPRQGQGQGKGQGQGHDKGGYQGRRNDRPHGNQDRNRGFQQAGHKPHGAKRQTVDPDSPFAKLAALKLELEKRTQEPPTSS